MSIASVTGPTPPGTGVIAPATAAALVEVPDAIAHVSPDLNLSVWTSL